MMSITLLAACTSTGDKAGGPGDTNAGGTAAAVTGLTRWAIATDGQAVVGATVVVADQEAVTDGRGRFHLAGIDRPVWVTVRAGRLHLPHPPGGTHGAGPRPAHS